jgi:hypothetical protein
LGVKKPIIIILALQTALLLFVSYRVILLESRALSSVAAADIAPSSANANTPPTITTPRFRSEEFVRRDDIRAVVREEMDAVADKIIAAMDERPPAAQPVSAPVMDPRELVGLKAAISGQISSFYGQGIITPTQLGALEQSISRLPPHERIKALGELNRAINNGQIEARF